VFSSCAGIVPYTRFCDPKPGFPLAEMIADENVLLKNVPNKDNDKEPTSVVLEESP
jgi:hypothetical protein